MLKSYTKFKIVKQGIVITDAFVDTSERKNGIAFKMIKKIVAEHPEETIWMAAIHPAIVKIAEKLGFKRVGGKGMSKVKLEDFPASVRASNAKIYRKN